MTLSNDCRGSSDISSNGSALVIGNLGSGVDVYETENFSIVSHITIQNKQNFPKQVSFFELDKVILAGTDRGGVWIITNGQRYQVLNHPRGMWVDYRA